MNKKIGFIGSGNMGGAIIGGIVGSSLVSPEQIIAADINQTNLENLKAKYNIQVTNSNTQVANDADILFLAVKPNIFPDIIKQIKKQIKKDVIIVSIAAGQPLRSIEKQFEKDIKLVRAMPNTPAFVGEGMSALSPNRFILEDEINQVVTIFNSLGKSEIVKESLMDAVIGVSGSAPAYVYMFIEAMADAAVAEGMPRAQAYTFAAQTVLGSAKMVLETNTHPGQLKDMVCSPGGTTIEAVIELEKLGMRSAVIGAVKAAVKKSKLMNAK